jgi:hypothetical protein
VAALGNVTLSNETITNLANETITNLANETLTALTSNVTQTLTTLNETATNQARLNEEARRNTTQTLAILNETATNQARLNEEARRNATEIIAREFKDLPNSISLMMGIAIILVIALPVVIDLFYPRGKGREERSDLYRALMTFGVIIVVGIVVVYLIALIAFNIGSTDNINVEALIDVLKNLSTILGTALAAIVAFYFGSKGIQREGGTSERPPGPSGGGMGGGRNATGTGGHGGDAVNAGTTNATTISRQEAVEGDAQGERGT